MKATITQEVKKTGLEDDAVSVWLADMKKFSAPGQCGKPGVEAYTYSLSARKTETGRSLRLASQPG